MHNSRRTFLNFNILKNKKKVFGKSVCIFCKRFGRICERIWSMYGDLKTFWYLLWVYVEFVDVSRTLDSILRAYVSICRCFSNVCGRFANVLHIGVCLK